MAQKDGLLPAYLIVGSDELRRRQVLTRLKSHVAFGFEDFNLDELTVTADTDPADVVASLDTLPMGPAPRIVVINPADKLPKPVSEALVTYLGNPNPSCTLALVAESLAKSTRLYKAVAKVGPKAVVECASKKRWELPDYVTKLARAHGVTIDQGAAQELVDRVGESTTMIDTQLATLSALLGGSGHVSRDLVEANVARTAEVKPWTFLDCLSDRNARKALELYALLSDSSALGLLSLMVTRLRELVCARSLDARGQGAAVASALGKQDWQVKGYVRWSRKFRDGELEHLLGRCAACERTFKGTGDSDAAMVSLILAICGVN